MFKLRNHNIILPKYLEIVKKKGSSLNFSAQGGRGKEKNCLPAAKKFASQSEGEAEGGCGGNSASPDPERSVSFAQRNFAQSLEYPTIRYFQNFLSQTEALPRGFAARQGRVPQGGTRQNPTARQTKRKPLFASKII